jgi:hypothetical protein
VLFATLGLMVAGGVVFCLAPRAGSHPPQ